MYRQILSIIACVITLNGFAQNAKLEKSIDDLSARLVSSQEVAGINILVLKDGEVLYDKAFGYADVETKQPLQSNNIFRIASQTKAITSVAVMMLWEQGKILLDDPISKYIPQFINTQVLDKFNSADSSYTTVPLQREITLRDLLRHTSGIDYPIISHDVRMQAIYAKAGAVTGIGSKGLLKEKIELLATQPLRHQPNTAFTYGLNTDVLGYLVEVVSGVPLDDFFRINLFKPLQMNDTQFKLPQGKASRLVTVSEKSVKGFSKVEHSIYENSSANYPMEDGIYLSGGAGLSSTTADYAKFLQLMLNKGTYDGKRILGTKTVELMTTNQLSQQVISQGDPDFRFGLGFELVTEENKFARSPSVGTFSWGGAFNTHYWADPKENIIGLVFTQEYFPTSYHDLETVYKNVVYANLDASN
ncbi:serine hydrolase domain-containing protein [Flavobacterium sp. JP2137]|uniref:serine hydrolase domain-containing protein n=1 Tax=Flavobacterium sp. JP2137 TaxID=3414510 RepID=UPI003D2FAAFF